MYIKYGRLPEKLQLTELAAYAIIKQKYLTLIVIIIIIIRGNTDDTADLDTHTIRYEMLFSTCALKPT